MGVLDECCDDCRCYSCREFWWCVLCLAVLAAVALIVVLVAAFGFVRHVSVTVDDASLTRLALVGGAPAAATAFAYNLSVTLTVRNPNWAMSMANTKPLDAAYSFDGQQFDRVRLAGEGDKHPAGKTRVYRLASGSDGAPVSLGNAGVAEFGRENATGVFEVEVAVRGEVKYTARAAKCAIEAICPLSLQLAPPGQAPAAVVFQKVKCKLAKAEKGC
ncbi:NDR1/HIN1-like protein 10 [Panicum virgatum]|uniref:Late embryogenesis abundant protein LEA-2 subgroup domain-containing protein n=1 Tax=Panicum virgatum TaxID=38727 RepID=A0A8T0VCH7_PANVG|nr:NDR1/HIN1-like protein 10 [Panicum virgatum]KAG2632528.1 hypothetical protein PVAP13_2NG114300 [Panicum virgatum]